MKVLPRGYWALLVNYLKPERSRVALLTALLFSSIGLQLVNPQIVRYFIDTAKSGGALQSLIVAASLFIGVALAIHVLSTFVTYLSEKVAWAATNRLRADLALHCLRLDMSFHNKRTPGEMIERIDGDVTALANFFSQFVIHLLGNMILLIGVLILLFREDLRVGLGLTGFAVVALAVLSAIRDIASPHWKEARQTSADLFGFLEERLSGAEDIRSSGATSYVMRRLYEFMRKRLTTERRAQLMNGIVWAIPWALFTLGYGAAFALGAYLFKAGSMTIGTVYMIFHYIEVLRSPLRGITNQIGDFQRASASIGRIQELYHAKSKIEDSRDGGGEAYLIPPGPPSVEFQNVSFEYDVRFAQSKVENEAVLENLSFQLRPCSVLGLLGRTGSGKTTITRLLFRFYDPTGGAIRLGGLDVRAVRLADLRRQVGIVTQDVQLFQATVRNNLTFFDKSVSDEGILEVIKELGLWRWYLSLPDGLDTELASGSGGLSAGEAQLLAFARVFLKDPGLVILDEASSRLDPATEQLIEQVTDKLLQNRTSIIIAHRLKTVQRVDEIMILEDGRICEHGPREQLASDPTSRFYSLLRTGLEEVMA
jgi:ABC-type multidrug transport system fused ATPase/permease subunit